MTDKRNFKNPNKSMALANLSIYYTCKNIIKSEYNNNKFKISEQSWNDTFDLPDGSYSTSDIQDYFKLSSKNLKLSLRIHQFKFIHIKLKTELF